MKKYYIYNLEQANFLLNKGIKPIEVGRGNKHIYILFPTTNEVEQAIDEWKHQGYMMKNNDIK